MPKEPGTLEVRLLGKFELSRDGKPVAIPSRPAQSLFAYLILSAGTAHRRERLAGLLWPDSSEESARENLRHGLWRLRKAVEAAPARKQGAPFIIADDMSISFNAEANYRVDAATIDEIDAEKASTDELIEALSSYEGELLPGFYEEWVLLERGHLQAAFERKMSRLLDRLAGERHWPEVLTLGERWIAFGQKPESAYRALMTAHAALGDMPKVAAAYERCAKALMESGIEPSEQTNQLYKDLKSGKGTPSAGAVSTKSVGRQPSSNIPSPLTSFIGREKELGEIASLLSSSRLLTLTGPGGVGKTRLAIEAANGSLKKFKDGVFWIGLVGLSDEHLIPQEIAQSLNVREVLNEPLIETLKTHLRSREILLVLDNCEHVITACAHVAEELLAACPKLRILATSIEALGLFNETTWQVPSLSLPARQGRISLSELQEFASIELFDERAGKAKSGFALDEGNASSVAKICQQLDGIPLAIELAAARIRVLSVDEIAARLDDRFSLLTAGSRTAIPRHQTLRATIDWSYDLLTEPERALLRRLSVFAGGFTLEAAEEVCSQGMKRGEILGLLGRLVDKSLVIAEADSEVGGTRYRLLETIRLYALEKLMEIQASRAMRDQHLKFYTKLAERAAPNAFGAGSVRYSDLIDRELDNIRSAMEWSLETHQALLAFRLLAALFYFWYNRSPLSEWYSRFEGALSLPEGLERTVERAKAINSISFFYWAGMSDVNPLPDLEDALSIGREFGDAHVIAQSLLNLGRIQTTAGNYSNARSLLLESLDIWRSLGSEHNVDIIFAQIFLG